VVGDDHGDMARAVNRLIELQGGCVAVAGDEVRAELARLIAGLMSERPFEEVADRLRALQRRSRDGLPWPTAPAARVSPLPVIHLKLTDLGLVDVDRFEPIAVLDSPAATRP
jgi:adenine deaminase